MTPRGIKGAHVNFGAPFRWDETENGPCSTIPARLITGKSFDSVETAWLPTLDELKILNQGGSVILRVVGGMPPVMLYAEPAEEIKWPGRMKD